MLYKPRLFFVICVCPIGVSKPVMALMLTVAGCIEMLCRIINGSIADRCFMSALSHLGLCMAVTATCAVICITVTGIVGMYTNLINVYLVYVYWDHLCLLCAFDWLVI